jgi:hypothetical protein
MGVQRYKLTVDDDWRAGVNARCVNFTHGHCISSIWYSNVVVRVCVFRRIVAGTRTGQTVT